jgi:hypothetical protein
MGVSFSHARDLVSAEHSLGLLFEPNLQHWAVSAGWPADVARWGYANLHFKGSCLMLAVLYFGYRGSYGFVRNAVFAAMAISVLGYAFFPTAPPRFLPELGLDPSSAVTGNNPLLSNPGDPLFNPSPPSRHARRALGDPRLVAGMLVRAPAPQGRLLRLSAADDHVVVASGNTLARRGLRPAHGRARDRRRYAPRPAQLGLVLRFGVPQRSDRRPRTGQSPRPPA